MIYFSTENSNQGLALFSIQDGKPLCVSLIRSGEMMISLAFKVSRENLFWLFMCISSLGGKTSSTTQESICMVIYSAQVSLAHLPSSMQAGSSAEEAWRSPETLTHTHTHTPSAGAVQRSPIKHLRRA